MKNPKDQQEKDVKPPAPEGGLPGINYDVQLPCHWQICQLAAMVGNQSSEDVRGDAHHRIKLAIEIWWETGLALEKLNDRIQGKDLYGDDFHHLAGPLKTGVHYMPRLPSWTQDDGFVPQEKYLEAAVGLAKAEDRMRWWRAFIEYCLKAEEFRRQDQFAPAPTGGNIPYFVKIPDNFSLPEGLFESTLAKQREDGIRLIPEGLRMALAFRRWRLRMEAPDRAAQKSYDLAEAAKKGLKAEQNKK